MYGKSGCKQHSDHIPKKQAKLTPNLLPQSMLNYSHWQFRQAPVNCTLNTALPKGCH